MPKEEVADPDEPLRRRVDALVLGAIDMWETFESARFLLGEHPEAPGRQSDLPSRVSRTLEAGMLLTYVRPFSAGRGSGIPALKRASTLTPELRASHEELMQRRNSVYTHTSRTSLRFIQQFADANEFEVWVDGGHDDELTEEWKSPGPAMLRDLLRLATVHLESFIDELHQVRSLLAVRRTSS